MIITKLDGGLGNQMFQFACGKSLALKNDVESYYLDLTAYKKNDFRKFELGIFGILSVEYPKYLKSFIQKSKNSFLESIKPIKRFSEKRYFTYDPKIENVNQSVYLDGYWQSEKYFKKYEDQIRSIFKFPSFVDNENLLVADDIFNINSISIHVRHGDYLLNNKTNEFHGICSPEYYKQSIEYIKSKVQNPKFFIFSDDPVWCEKEFMSLSNKIVVAHNNESKSYNDMHLMSLCKHNIIANSSFSWWGAWLNSNSEKIVIAPKKWINDDHYPTTDICPAEWIRI